MCKRTRTDPDYNFMTKESNALQLASCNNHYLKIST